MPDKVQSDEAQSKSIQVDVDAHAKVQDLSAVMGIHQRIAASLLIEVADEETAIKRHHANVLKRFGDRSQTPRPRPDDRRSTGGPDPGTPAPANPGPGGQRPASRPPAGGGRPA